jgi:hypothetical protein
MYRTKENDLIRNKSQRNLIRNKSQRANIYRQGQSGAPNESLWSANPCSKFEDKFLLHMLQLNGFQQIKVDAMERLRQRNQQHSEFNV